MYKAYSHIVHRYPKIPLAEERCLILKAQKGSKKCKDELVLRHIGFLIFRIHKVAFPEMEEINEKKSRVLMLARDNSIFPVIVKSIKNIDGARIIYSMWEGYLIEEFKNWIAQKGLVIESVHTSGHATLQDLKAFARALKPRTLIPIHTFEPGQYPVLFSNVRIMRDGEVLDLGQD